MDEGKGHPLPASGEARHDEIPEGVERDKGRGQDPAEIAAPHPEAVNPDGEPYRSDATAAEEHGEPEPGP